MDDTSFIFRQCITLKNGKRICMPAGKAFRIPVNDNYKPRKPRDEGPAKETG